MSALWHRLSPIALGLAFSFVLVHAKIWGSGNPINSIPLTAIFLGFFLVVNYRELRRPPQFVWVIAGLACYGMLVGLVRYLLIYRSEGFLIGPVFRQTAGFSVGLLSLLGFCVFLPMQNAQRLVKVILLTALLPLCLGVYQVLSGQTVGHYVRITATFQEPAHFGDFLIFILLPMFFMSLSHAQTLRQRLLHLAYGLLLLFNILGIQSGTGLIKIALMMAWAMLLAPMGRKLKLTLLAMTAVFMALIIYVGSGYVQELIGLAYQVWNNPNVFFQHNTFYDRLYPIYPALKNLLDPIGLFGLGFGGDYYEFKNLYPTSVHAEMLNMKHSLSYFNSFASKVVLFFGFFGVLLLGLMAKTAWKAPSPWTRTVALTALTCTLMGLSNFALPYLWFWLAMSVRPWNQTSG